MSVVSYDLLLVSCAYEKLDRPAEARDLYISDRFRLARRFAEQRSQPWFILSGEHALVRPVDWLAPYDTRPRRHAAGVPVSLGRLGSRQTVPALRQPGRLSWWRSTLRSPTSIRSPRPLKAAGSALQLPLADVAWSEWAAWYQRNGHGIAIGGACQ